MCLACSNISISRHGWLVAQVVWKDVVAEALDGLGLFKGEA